MLGKKEIPDFTEKQIRFFLNYDYPGNVRELGHLLERFCLLGGSPADLFAGTREASGALSTDFDDESIFSSPKPLKAAAQRAKSQAEKQVLIQALKKCDHDYAKTAKKLNICLASLYNKIKEYGVSG